MRAILIVVGLLVLVAGALLSYRTFVAATPIAQINANPRRFDGRAVLLRGSVQGSAGLLGYGAYELDDGTGRIAVVTDAGVPVAGTRVVVRGMVKNTFTLGDTAGVVVVEKKHP